MIVMGKSKVSGEDFPNQTKPGCLDLKPCPSVRTRLPNTKRKANTAGFSANIGTHRCGEPLGTTWHNGVWSLNGCRNGTGSIALPVWIAIWMERSVLNGGISWTVHCHVWFPEDFFACGTCEWATPEVSWSQALSLSLQQQKADLRNVSWKNCQSKGCEYPKSQQNTCSATPKGL